MNTPDLNACPRMTAAAKDGRAIDEGCKLEVELAATQKQLNEIVDTMRDNGIVTPGWIEHTGRNKELVRDRLTISATLMFWFDALREGKVSLNEKEDTCICGFTFAQHNVDQVCPDEKGVFRNERQHELIQQQQTKIEELERQLAATHKEMPAQSEIKWLHEFVNSVVFVGAVVPDGPLDRAHKTIDAIYEYALAEEHHADTEHKAHLATLRQLNAAEADAGRYQKLKSHPAYQIRTSDPFGRPVFECDTADLDKVLDTTRSIHPALKEI